MIKFRPIENDELLLKLSPLVRAIDLTLNYIDAQNGIELTKGMAFNRKFIHWAAKEFHWPGHSYEELFQIQKVLNEPDFPVCKAIHILLLQTKVGRHFKGKFLLTAKGKKLLGKPSEIFNNLVPRFLFEIDHSYGYYRSLEQPMGNWDVFLNIMNVELQAGINGTELANVFYGARERTPYNHDTEFYALYNHVIKPLCWVGLIQEAAADIHQYASEKMFQKTQLWAIALQLDTDHMLKPVQL